MGLNPTALLRRLVTAWIVSGVTLKRLPAWRWTNAFSCGETGLFDMGHTVAYTEPGRKKRAPAHA
jgi:hypothetical protein